MNTFKLVGRFLWLGACNILFWVFAIAVGIVVSVLEWLAMFALGAIVLYFQLGIAAWIFIRVFLWLIHKH